MTKNRGNANEKYLYHGTSPKVIDNICAQNFDFRMSGKNATMFGKGSYFASTALYSHKYTSKDFNLKLFNVCCPSTCWEIYTGTLYLIPA